MIKRSDTDAARSARAHLVAEGVLAYDPGAPPVEPAAAPTEPTEPTVLARFAGWQPSRDLYLEHCFDCGSRLRQAGPLPLIAAQTWFSRLLGSLAPLAWEAFLAGFGAVADERLLLADRGDLAGLPAALQAWGRERLAVGATLLLPSGDEALLLAPSHPAYARLCRLLSRCHEEPGVLQRWQAGSMPPPDGEELVALVRDDDWVLPLREAGIEVYWRDDLVPGPVPAGLVPVAAPLIRHAHADAAAAQPVLDALRLGRRVLPAEPEPGALLSAVPDIWQRFRGQEDRLERGRELLARCRYVPDGAIQLPAWADGDADAQLRCLAEQGLRQRYPDPVSRPPAWQRLRHELRVIRGKNFASYILTVYELAQQRRTCGRGSAASSMVCYCLGLTNVDPVRYQLVFERFLAPERSDPPDIDLDFPWDERDAVFAHALRRHGPEHIAMVSTHLHFRAWSALREVARVQRQPRAAISAVKRALRSVGKFGGSVPLPAPWPQLLQQAAGVLQAPRHFGLHPGGVVITSAPVRDLVPVHPAAKRVAGQPLPAIAWEKDGAEALGLVKIDLLGNRSLAVVRDCLADLDQLGVRIDEHRWRPQDDPAAKRLIGTGRSMGCFYIESPAMRQLNAKAGSGDFDRLVVHSSIIRPAANRWINDYLERLHYWYRHHEERPEWYPHPTLRGLLSMSFGILSYQEDVMLVARELAGFGSAEQNQLRKVLGKADTRERLRAFADRFASGCRERAVSAPVIELVWGMISSFAGYSFCKAHSASYAMVSFQCAWLKAHYPAVFLARVIANGGGFYGVSAYLEEARRHGIAIKGPCVQRSQWPTHAEGMDAIRVGLHLIPGLRRATAELIVTAAGQRPFLSFTDFWLRCRPTAREVASLEAAGAFNRLLIDYHPTQRQALQQTVIHDYPDHLRDDPLARQLLEQRGLADPSPDPDLSRPDGHAVLRARFAHLGFLPQMHPLLLWPLPERRLRLAHVGAHQAGRHIQVHAWCITRKQVVAQGRDQCSDEPMAFVTMEDETGLVETVWFPACYRRYGWLLEQSQPLCLSGVVQVEYGFPVVQVERVATSGSVSQSV